MKLHEDFSKNGTRFFTEEDKKHFPGLIGWEACGNDRYYPSVLREVDGEYILLADRNGIYCLTEKRYEYYHWKVRPTLGLAVDFLEGVNAETFDGRTPHSWGFFPTWLDDRENGRHFDTTVYGPLTEAKQNELSEGYASFLETLKK